jgi:hypothetical protein
MAVCTAPVNGHRTSSGAEACPACRSSRRHYGSYSRGYGSYGSSSSTSYSPREISTSTSRPRWSPTGSSVIYTSAEITTLTPFRKNIEEKASIPSSPQFRDVFLCHAWDDRKDSAKELHDLLEAKGVTVWFSEKDVQLGTPLLREIDRGIAKSRVGIVLVTPALLTRLAGEGIADKELSALLARDQLIPIVHNTTYEALREISPLLGSRSGLSTQEDTMVDVAAKLAELVAS